MGVEPHGPKRITPENKRPVPIWVMACIWSSGTFSLSSIILGILLGACVTGWCSTFCSATGLRQVSVAKYRFGWWPAKLIGLSNLNSQVGWAAVGCITGGNYLSAASDYSVSIILGVVIIAVVLVDAISRYLLIYFGYVGSYQHNRYTAPATITGITKSGAILDFFAIYYGNGASWATIASDYYVHYPVNTSKVKIFALTTLGICLPIFVTSLLGALLAAEMNVRPEWSDAYYDKGVVATSCCPSITVGQMPARSDFTWWEYV
ncbi:Vitamin B6 transporter [Lachnellula subtilissima]|uniref:Vitamin B6 transporter n=1 Tax=Lachnellula subtilissima TaxID=602034 RepID=A0A8H8RW06_9HELO|nr:Vitamin B6 transporter [Lachnellula subtilissima]